MFNFITVKKNTFIAFIIIIFIICVSITTIINTYSKNTETLSNKSLENNKEYDFDSDGENDQLTIISTNSTYSIKIKNSIGEILLKSNEFDYSLIDITSSCNINISYIDLNRNKIPELIISGFKNNKPTFYIFQWKDNTFQEVLFSQNNILGILDYNNSRTPKIYITNSTTGDKGTNGYILNANSIKDITFSNPTIPSLGNIQTLINLIEADYELDDAPDIFTAYIPSEELGILWNLDKSTYRYSFQKGYFYDISWDDSGRATSIYWILSFEKVNFIDSDSSPKELTMYVKAELEESDEYKISSIIKN
ncbi:hypothetical protein [Clostridium sp. D43t1_170807_H7]|uniref:hypothetical protein n=1 Tax=Clostridium sp. D43t1_170807_H7 TaxID=2787140 RepID=UPI00189C3674|nr:hypothetical protein [Clostridium sp. D43t1_170807_H7]MEE0932537.1 hypothetical protein [Clostridium sp.]